MVAGYGPGMRMQNAPFGGFFSEGGRIDDWERKEAGGGPGAHPPLSYSLGIRLAFSESHPWKV
jgi:hypothetical protein